MKAVILGALITGLSACAVIDPLVYRISIPQGNYVEQRDINELRIGMTREQVQYVLGSPVVENTFRDDTWIYLYRMKPGRGDVVRRELRIEFENDLVASLAGDFEEHEDFGVPLTQ